MIAHVTGEVTAITSDSAVLEVGGVGLVVLCTPAVLATLRVGEITRVSTSLVVREDSLSLYGFADDDERSVFEILQTATGVGPKLAQAVLSVHRPDALRAAVASDDLDALMLVSGVGRKGAARLALELKDRLGAPHGTTITLPLARESGWQSDLQSALVGLGWSARQAEQAVIAVSPLAPEPPEQPDLSTMLRAALQTLSHA